MILHLKVRAEVLARHVGSQYSENVDHNNHVSCQDEESVVLYMSFDRFILSVESHDLSQADKSNIRVSLFPKLSDG